MKIQDIATLVNSITKEITGDIALLQEDLSNVVEVGTSIENAGGLDNYVKALPNVIGRMIFVNRTYRGSAPSVLRDGWEFGSILAKVHSKMPEAQQDEAWALQNGASYDMDIFTKPDVFAKFYNGATAFEIPLSVTEMQVKESFHSATELNAFLSMLFNEIEKSMTVKTDEMIMRTINNFAAETIYDGVGTTYGNTSVRAINLLKLYNTQFSQSLTAANCLFDKAFIRFAILKIKEPRGYLRKINTVFNMGGAERFTPNDMLHTVFLDKLDAAARVYLYDAEGQFRTDDLSFGEYETVPYWQGCGQDFAFDKVSEIKVKTADGHEVDVTGVLGIMFDRDAIMVCNEQPRTRSHFNEKGEFWNYWYKWKCSYYNDFNEQCVVFFVHDAV